MSFQSTQNLHPTYNSVTTDGVISTNASIINLELNNPIISTNNLPPTITDLGYYLTSENGTTENFVSGVESILAETLNDNPIGVYQANVKTALSIQAGTTIDSFFLSLIIGNTTILQKPETMPITYTNTGVTTTTMSIWFFQSCCTTF